MSESIEQLAIRAAQAGDWRIANWLEFEAHKEANDDVTPVNGLLDTRKDPKSRMRFIEFREACEACGGSGVCYSCGEGDCPQCAGIPGEDEVEYRDLSGRRVTFNSLPRAYVVPAVRLKMHYNEALAEHREAAA